MTDGSQTRALALVCPVCDKPSSAAVVGQLDVGPVFGPGDVSWPLPSVVSLLRCEHCHEPLLVVQEEYGRGLDDPFVLWPSNGRVLSSAIPDALRDELAEARACFKAKAYKATAVMVRRTLEGFAREQNASGRSLHESLSALRSSGIIDGRLLEWTHGLRGLGNDGAHYSGDPITRQDAKDALELAEALLDYVYVFGARYEAFKSRRTPPNTPPTGAVK